MHRCASSCFRASSQVKHASSALVEWATAAKKHGDLKSLERVGNALLGFLRGTTKPTPGADTDSSCAGAGASTAYSSTTACASPVLGKVAIQTRLIAPTLRTLSLLLECGSMDVLRVGVSKFPTSLVNLVRLRCNKVWIRDARKDVELKHGASRICLSVYVSVNGSMKPKGGL